MNDKRESSLDAHTDYGSTSLDEADAGSDPFALFARWFTAAESAGLYEPNAMVIATIDADGRPSSRTVLLKGFGDSFEFVTNYDSRKGRALALNPGISLLFPWYSMQRQVIVTGTAQIAPPEVSERYFNARPRESRIASMASIQSRPIASRQALEDQVAAMKEQHSHEVPVLRPANWGAFQVIPQRIEFWQGRTSRIHDRLEYTATTTGGWTRLRLQP